MKSGNKASSLEVLATDKKFDSNKAQLLVNVVEPAWIDLKITDVSDKLNNSFNPRGYGKTSYQNQLGIEEWDNQWVLVEKRKYLLKAVLYDEHNRKIHLSDNLNFGQILDKTHLKALQINKIGSEILFEVLPLKDQKAQTAMVQVDLNSIKSMSPPLTYTPDRLVAEKELTITSPV